MIKIKYLIVIGTITFLSILGGGFQAYAVNNLLNESLQYTFKTKQKISSIKNVRKINQEGLKINVISPDNSTTTIILRERSNSLTPEGSIQLFKLPTNEQILNTPRIGYETKWRDTRILYKVDVFESGVRDYIAQSLEDVIFEAKPASYRVISNKIEIEPHSKGQAVNTDNIVLLIKNRLQTLDPNDININVEEYNPYSNVDVLSKHKDFANSISKWKGVILAYNSHKISLSGRDILEAIRFDINDRIYLDVDTIRVKLKPYIGHMIEKPASPPLFSIVNNKITVKSAGTIGFDVDIDGVASKISEYLSYRVSEYSTGETWPSTKYDLVISKHSTNLTKSKLLSMGIDSMLGRARISYVGSSEDRIHNIALGSRRVTGTIVSPGQEFSLVEAIGYTSTSTGYKEEYVIKENRSRKEAGGGLCQVATTFFRAVLDAGLKITERHNHRYVVGYYGPGLDAGIYDINHDFRFINDTANDIFLQTYTENGYMVVEIFGKSDGRKSVTSKPIETQKIKPPSPEYFFGNSIPIGKTECTDKPRGGMTTYATTTITYKDGSESIRVWKSVYTPWPKICIVGTKGLGVFQYDN